MKLNFKLFLIIITVFAGIYSIRHTKFNQNDFRAYYLAGERIVAKTFGMDIKQRKDLTNKELFKSNESIYQDDDIRRFKYSPTIAFLYAPFSFIPYTISQYFYFWFCFLFLVMSFYLIYQQFKEGFFKDNKTTFWFFLLLFLVQLRSNLSDMKMIQVNFIMLFCAVGFLVWRKNRPWTASFLLALMVGMKIFPVFFLVFLLVEKDFKMLGKTILMGIGLILLPLISYGGDLYGEYLNYFNFMTNGQHIFPAPASFRHPSLDSFIVRHFMDLPYHANFKVNFFSWDPQSTFYLIVGLKVFLLGMIVWAQKKLGKDELSYWAKFALYLNYIIVINPLAWKHALVSLTISWAVVGLIWLKNRHLLKREKLLGGISVFFLALSSHGIWGDFARTHLAKLSTEFVGITILSILLFVSTRKWLKLNI